MRLAHHVIARYQVATLFALTLSAQAPRPAGQTLLREVDVAVPMRDGSPVTCTREISRPCRRGGNARPFASITAAGIFPRWFSQSWTADT